jgi:hypothetical protein
MAAFKSNDPFAVSGKPFINATPGINATRNPPGTVRLPAPPRASAGARVKLAKALAARLGSSKGSSFLP